MQITIPPDKEKDQKEQEGHTKETQEVRSTRTDERPQQETKESSADKPARRPRRIDRVVCTSHKISTHAIPQPSIKCVSVVAEVIPAIAMIPVPCNVAPDSDLDVNLQCDTGIHMRHAGHKRQFHDLMPSDRECPDSFSDKSVVNASDTSVAPDTQSGSEVTRK